MNNMESVIMLNKSIKFANCFVQSFDRAPHMQSNFVVKYENSYVFFLPSYLNNVNLPFYRP